MFEEQGLALKGLQLAHGTPGSSLQYQACNSVFLLGMRCGCESFSFDRWFSLDVCMYTLESWELSLQVVAVISATVALGASPSALGNVNAIRRDNSYSLLLAVLLYKAYQDLIVLQEVWAKATANRLTMLDGRLWSLSGGYGTAAPNPALLAI